MRKLWVYFKHDIADLNIDECGIQEYSPEEEYQYNVYQNFVIHYVVSGEGYFTINHTTYHLKKGDGYIIRNSEFVHYFPNQSNPWTTMWVALSGEKLNDYLLGTKFLNESVIRFHDNGHSQKIIEDICSYTLSNQNELPGDFWYKSKAYLLLHHIKHEFANMEYSLSSLSKNAAEIAYDYINNNYMKDISIETVANYIGISRSYLYKLFKNKYNFSPQQFLLDKRLTIAASLLLTSNLSINEIADNIGFKDPLYFSKSFTKYYHESPTQYRKKHEFVYKESWDKYK